LWENDSGFQMLCSQLLKTELFSSLCESLSLVKVSEKAINAVKELKAKCTLYTL